MKAKEAIAKTEKKKDRSPLLEYFDLESRLFKDSSKPIEIKSALVWGALSVAVDHEGKPLAWDRQMYLYADFMSKLTNVR